MPDLSLFLPATVLLLLTPGPTNTLLALSGAQAGLRRSLPLIPAELAGYLLAISGWGVGLALAGAALPWLPPLLRMAAAVYLVFLALRLWRQGPDTGGAAPGGAPGRPVDAAALFATTLLNPKALIFAGGIFPAGAFAQPDLFAQSFALFAATLPPIALTWIALGASLPAAVGQGAGVRRGVALLLVVFAVWIGKAAIPWA